MVVGNSFSSGCVLFGVFTFVRMLRKLEGEKINRMSWPPFCEAACTIKRNKMAPAIQISEKKPGQFVNASFTLSAFFLITSHVFSGTCGNETVLPYLKIVVIVNKDDATSLSKLAEWQNQRLGRNGRKS